MSPVRSLPLAVAIFLGALVLAPGCAGVAQQTSADEVRAFFGTANEVNFQEMQCGSAKQLDLSGYTHLMGVKYPPTQVVEVLNRPPSRPYQVFAVLEAAGPHAAGTYDPQILDRLKTKARAIGADAIIFPSPADQTCLPGLQKSSSLAAVAVKYRLGGQPARTGTP